MTMAKKRKNAGDTAAGGKGGAGVAAGGGGEPPQLAVMKNGKPVVAGPCTAAASHQAMSPAIADNKIAEKMSSPAPKRKKTSKKPASTPADSESGMSKGQMLSMQIPFKTIH